jgi:hypothetical protein
MEHGHCAGLGAGLRGAAASRPVAAHARWSPMPPTDLHTEYVDYRSWAAMRSFLDEVLA